MDILTGTAATSITVVVAALIREIDDARQLDHNRRLLEIQLNRMKVLLIDITDQFERHRKTPPQSLRNCLQRMQHAVLKARDLIDRSQRPHHCLEFFFCAPTLSRDIKEWKKSLDLLFDELRTDFSVFCTAQQVASATPQEAEIELNSWVTEAPQTRIIGVYGSGGVGKATMLRKMYNSYKVSDVFDDAIWVPVGQFPNLELQGSIASEVNLDLTNCNNDLDMRRMMLSAYLKKRKFFLVLENMLRKLDLNELGVEFSNDKDSKIVFSTENRNLIEEMKADGCMKIQPMSTEDTWGLFSSIAFKDVHIPGK